MYGSTANLSVASKKLNQYNLSHPLLIDAGLELTTAVALMEAHYKVKYSIFWKRSSHSTKKRISEKLNHLAFDAYTSLLEAGKLLNQYVDEVGSVHVLNSFPNWGEIILCLNQADSCMKESHRVESKQLTLSL